MQSMVELDDILGMLLGGLIVLIPLTGLTARFALKPIVDAVIRLREGSTTGETVQLLERRMALLEQEVQSLNHVRDQVARLSESADFDRQLTAPRT